MTSWPSRDCIQDHGGRRQARFPWLRSRRHHRPAFLVCSARSRSLGSSVRGLLVFFVVPDSSFGFDCSGLALEAPGEAGLAGPAPGPVDGGFAAAFTGGRFGFFPVITKGKGNSWGSAGLEPSATGPPTAHDPRRRWDPRVCRHPGGKLRASELGRTAPARSGSRDSDQSDLGRRRMARRARLGLDLVPPGSRRRRRSGGQRL